MEAMRCLNGMGICGMAQDFQARDRRPAGGDVAADSLVFCK